MILREAGLGVEFIQFQNVSAVVMEYLLNQFVERDATHAIDDAVALALLGCRRRQLGQKVYACQPEVSQRGVEVLFCIAALGSYRDAVDRRQIGLKCKPLQLRPQSRHIYSSLVILFVLNRGNTCMSFIQGNSLRVKI